MLTIVLHDRLSTLTILETKTEISNICRQPFYFQWLKSRHLSPLSPRLLNYTCLPYVHFWYN